MAMPEVYQNISKIDLLAPQGVVFGRVDYDAGGTFGPRTQPDVQLVILDRGSARVTTDGHERVVAAGQVICQWPGGREIYRFDPERNSTHRWVALHFDDGPETAVQIRAWRSVAEPIRRETPTMRGLFDTAFALGRGDRAAVAIARTHLALAYLAAYLAPKRVETGSVGVPLPRPLELMLATIAEHYPEPLTLDDLADAASVSGNHLVRLCRKHLDTTPIRMLWDARVDHGRELLRDTGLTVGEIAHRVGFANPYHYSRLFKARHRLSPSAYRRHAWAGR